MLNRGVGHRDMHRQLRAPLGRVQGRIEGHGEFLVSPTPGARFGVVETRRKMSGESGVAREDGARYFSPVALAAYRHKQERQQDQSQ